MKTKKKTIRSSKDLLENGLISEDQMSMVDEIGKQFATSITPQVFETINFDDPNDPIRKQYVPTKEELNISPAELDDPIGDHPHTPVKGIVHRYPDRVLLKIVNVCPVYCRFCFRKELIGPGSEFLSKSEVAEGLQYIKENDSIWEVILTGGDPLVLSTEKIGLVLRKLDEIEHVKVIRFHTRIPVVKSQNVTDELVEIMKSLRATVYLVVHTNHVNELTEEACACFAKLADAGIPLLSQTVLLKDINDNKEALSELMKGLVINRVKPYYLHHGDYAKGTAHFRTTIKKGQSLMHYLRAKHSGLCHPSYVIDLPEGRGKVSIDYNYLEDLSTDPNVEKWKIEDNAGLTLDYPLD